MKVLLVHNAGSRSGGEVSAEELGHSLRALGEVSKVTPSVEHFEREVQEAADGAQIVCVAGGDGSLNRSVGALRERLDELTFALVPLGTGNDFARALRIPLDPMQAARGLAAARRRAVDICEATSAEVTRTFVNACMGGFPVLVNEKISGDLKRRLGPLAFWAGGVAALADVSRHTVRVNGESYDECVAVGIGNGRTAGGGIEIFPDARSDDGQLDLTVLPVTGPLQAVGLLNSLREGDHVDKPEVVTSNAPAFEVDAEPAMEFNVDGEVCGLRTPIRFAIVARTTFLVPPDDEDVRREPV